MIAGRMDIPLIDSFDVLFTEGTVAALELALHLARNGRRVGVVTRATSFPFEVASCMRAWVSDDSSNLPGRVGAALSACPRPDGTLHIGRAGEAVEDLLIDAGVRFYYDAHPVGGLIADGRPAGAVVGGKFGMAAVAAGAVIDTGAGALVARSLGAAMRHRSAESAEVSLVVHATGAASAALFADGTRIEAHGAFVEITRSVDIDVESDFWYSEAVLAARRALYESADVAFVEAVRTTAIDRAADDILVTPRFRLDSGEEPGHTLTLDSTVTGLHGLLVVGPASNLTDSAAATLGRDWGAALAAAVALAPALSVYVSEYVSDADSNAEEAGAGERLVSARRIVLGSGHPLGRETGERTDGITLHATDPGYDQPGARMVSVIIPACPVTRESDVVVTGAGTAGLPAAAVAARHGSRVVCTEKHAEPGGTNTVGGVALYWFGRWSAFFRQHFLRLRAFEEEHGLPPAFAQLKIACDAGVELLPRTVTVGSATRTRQDELGGGRRSVVASLVVSSNGLAAVAGRYFADATGDGDLAAWCGAPYTYGSERDDITMWCSFGKFHGGNPEASRQYLTVADQRGVRDITRAIVAGRRQSGILGDAEYPQFYLVNRESRHIRGEKRIRCVDMLMDVDYHDTAFVCRANVDIKGLGSSDASLAGFVEPKFLGTFTAHIPYGAMVPTTLDNLIIAGRAYSISHDGLAMARMQPDMITMGAAAGAALDYVRRKNVAFRFASVMDLQAIWTELGTVEHEELVSRREHEEHGLSDFDLKVLCERLALGPVDLDDQARALAQGSRAVPYLRKSIRRSVHRCDVLIARMLCCLGDSAANDILLARLSELVADGRLPESAHSHHIFPDHGVAPEPVYLVQSLALTRDQRLVPQLARIVERLDLDPEESDSRFTYAYAICYAAERLASPPCMPIVEAVLDQPAVSGRRVGSGEDIRAVADPVAERYAYIELSCFRALARCGSRRGFDGLIAYLDDRRSFLHRSARLELRGLTGLDFGYDQAAWIDRVNADSSSTIPRPLTTRFD